jgi:hypothetical protein
MPEDKVDPDELREFLNANQGLRDDDNWGKTQYTKLVCYLGWLEGGRGYSGPDADAREATRGK